MQAIALSTNSFSVSFSIISHQFRYLLRVCLLLLSAIGLASCGSQTEPQVRAITLQQQWVLNPGDEIAGSIVAGSLGDISLSLKNGKVNAPFDGELELSETERCALYSTPEIPAYLFRLCGLKSFDYGEVKAGKQMGKGDFLSFATLRRQPDGSWIIVEPAKGVLEKTLSN
ncbi:MAG: hypothetical protein HLUCCA11_09895 [Phormidesmis priestleyi Ana]|uniref:Uncharacterized protein n=1 Tax=Phormidesmis priestleyi Ana TaxID=1666911 RepID=A0A0P7YYY8_9CYAN|nr:MAG: hypothetical protein HLUCCA11_09895 [Phormidesmis priestleyi Ana]